MVEKQKRTNSTYKKTPTHQRLLDFIVKLNLKLANVHRDLF
jgi:hypothetical protein